MKKLLCILLVLVQLCSFAACQQEEEIPVEEAPVEVAQTEKKEDSKPSDGLFWPENLNLIEFKVDWEATDLVEATLQELTDPKHEGRLVGSKGNRAVADWIEEQFVQLGLQQYPDLGSWRHTFEGDVYETMVGGEAWLVKPDGTEVALTQGVDWLSSSPFEDIDVTLPLTEDRKTAEAGEAFLDENVETQGHTRKSMGIRSGDISAGWFPFNVDHAAIRIKVSDDVYSQLKQDGYRFHLKLPQSASVGNIDNVVGYLPGKDKSKVVLFGAHFDGSGVCGGLLNPGAFDNASGTAALMQTAAYLSVAEQLPCDVVFVAFNSEENGVHGSNAFASYFKDQYEQTLAVNIDCFGWKDSQTVIYGGECPLLCNKLGSALNYPNFGKLAYSGDQKSFVRNKMEAVTISQTIMNEDGIHDIVHSTQDTLDLLDTELIDKLAKDLAAWLIERGGEPLETQLVFW